MSRESNRLKKSSSGWLISGNALIQQAKNAILVIPVLPGSAETQVTSGGIVKRLLIAYFIGNISAKEYQNPFMCIKVIASQRWDVFLRHGVLTCAQKLTSSQLSFVVCTTTDLSPIITGSLSPSARAV